MELLSASIGLCYLKKYRESWSRYFVFFLCFTFLFELMGFLTTQISDDFLSFLMGTNFEKNHWLYNPFIIFNFLFYFLFFTAKLESTKIKSAFKYLAVFYLGTSVLNLIISDFFFSKISSYSFIVGSIFLLISVLYYFFEVLQSDNILIFKSSFAFYVAVGALVFHLCVSPLVIYSIYLTEASNPVFVKINVYIFTIANIFMYTCYSIGFVVCSKENKSY